MLRLQSEEAQILVAKAYEAHQEQIFTWWEALSPQQREGLLEQVRKVDFQLLMRLVAKHVKGCEPTGAENPFPRPAEITFGPRTPEDFNDRHRWRAIGEDAIRGGEIALFVAAGGLGSRLGLDGPKGFFPVGPVSRKSLFQLHAEKIRALGRRHRTSLPWFVMTSAAVHQPTTGFFREHGFFGLGPGDVYFVEQPMVPIVDRRGLILMASKERMAMSPSGHGAAIEILQRDPVRRILEERGIRHVFYFQVDNPLVRIGDPVFIGFHIEKGAEISSKAVTKIDPDEKVGVFCTRNGRLSVIEHTELDEDLKARRRDDAGLLFSAGNIAVHLFQVDFVDALRDGGKALPFHLARRATPYLDKRGRRIRPKTANGHRFEQFVFDVLSFADRSAILEVEREEEFSPIKNPTGADSPETARRDLSSLFGSWLRRAGVEIPVDEQGHPVGLYEISPLIASSAEELKDRLDGSCEVESPYYLE